MNTADIPTGRPRLWNKNVFDVYISHGSSETDYIIESRKEPCHLPTLASQSAGITGVSHYTQPSLYSKEQICLALKSSLLCEQNWFLHMNSTPMLLPNIHRYSWDWSYHVSPRPASPNHRFASGFLNVRSNKYFPIFVPLDCSAMCDSHFSGCASLTAASLWLSWYSSH